MTKICFKQRLLNSYADGWLFANRCKTYVLTKVREQMSHLSDTARVSRFRVGKWRVELSATCVKIRLRGRVIMLKIAEGAAITAAAAVMFALEAAINFVSLAEAIVWYTTHVGKKLWQVFTAPDENFFGPNVVGQ
jgi:hypothetical protein